MLKSETGSSLTGCAAGNHVLIAKYRAPVVLDGLWD